MDFLKRKKSLQQKESAETKYSATRILLNNTLPTDLPETISLSAPHSSNKVSTSKYSLWSFIPKNLYEQFRQIANFYFTFLVILQTQSLFKTVDIALTATPVIIVIGFTSIKDAVEDWKRHVADNNVNNAITYFANFKKNSEHEYKESLFDILKKLFRALPSPLYFFQSANSKIYKEKLTVYDYLSAKDLVPESARDKTVSLTEAGRKSAAKRPEYWTFKRWQDVKVGDFILLRNDEFIPADIIIFSTSEEDSACYVETKNLDGETNLKVRHGIPFLTHIKTPEQCSHIKGYVDTEYPTSNMYNYTGTAHLSVVNDDIVTERSHPLGINSVLLRGCILRNTDWVIGVVSAVGSDTKLMMNQGHTPSKRSRIDRQLNPQILLNFMILFALCLICGVLGAVYQGAFNFNQVLFAPIDSAANGNADESAIPIYIALITFFYCMIIFQNIIPIAIYISVDIAKSFQSLMIYQDMDMVVDGDLSTRALPRSWNLCDDLGQIEYIFSDKTGTLTCNVMAFRKCSINGVIYGNSFVSEATLGAAMKDSDKSNAAEFSSSKNLTDPTDRAKNEIKMREIMASMFDSKYVNNMIELPFVDVDMHRHIAEGLYAINSESSTADSGGASTDQAAAIIEFFTLLAVCHTVLVETPDESNPNHLDYKAQSPDEAALVAGAKDNGFTFLRRVENRVEVDIMGTIKVFHILNVLEFNSDRKRMSVIVRKDGEEDAVLLCKGADSVIYDRILEGSDENLLKITTSHLEKFANEGLRTLCLAYRIVPAAEYNPWAERYLQAQASVVDRDAQVEAVAGSIEVDLTLMGATAIEDKLQDGVPESIATLAKAGIKIWVLTGDKMETAINIGFACNLLKRDMLLIIVKSADSEETTRKQLTDALGMFWSQNGIPLRGENYGLIIDGVSLKYAFEPSCRSFFLELACRCKAVICCRVSPLQKALVVALVRNGLSAMCLAIGDGANDVSMIQEADVGVGISGKEGLQAVMASDYAISQFRFLTRLLLVHGRWAYMRTAELILNYFYKNVVWLFVLFWYQFDSGFTGDIVTDFTYGMFFNTVFSLLPNMTLGMVDHDVNDRISLQVPQLYQSGIRQTLYNMERFWFYIFDAIFQSVICYYSAVLLFVDASTDTRGYDAGKDEMGTFIAFYAVITVNLYMGFNNFSWNWITHVALWFSIALFVGYVIFFSAYYTDVPNRTFGQVFIVFTQPAFYLSVVLTVVVSLFPRFVFKYAQQSVAPTDIDIVQEYQKYSWKEGDIVDLDFKRIKKSTKKTASEVSPTSKDSLDVISQIPPLAPPITLPKSPTISIAANEENITNANSLKRMQANASARKVDSKTVFGSMLTNMTGPAVPTITLEQPSPSSISPASLAFPVQSTTEQPALAIEEGSSSTSEPHLSQSRNRGYSAGKNSATSMHDLFIQPLTDLSRKTGEFVKSMPRRLRIPSLNPQRRNPSITTNPRSMVFMGTLTSPTQEISNTGFAFSHDGGMEEVITPSRIRRESIIIEREKAIKEADDEK